MKIIPIVNSQRQRGFTLALGLIMLLITTLIVVTNFNMTQANLNAAGNLQYHNEAIAAATTAIENQINSNFFINPTASTFDVDINNDLTPDYQVALAAPICVKVQRHEPNCEATGTCTSEEVFTGDETRFTTTWELNATVDDVTTGASINIISGVRVLLTEVEYNSSSCI